MTPDSADSSLSVLFSLILNMMLKAACEHVHCTSASDLKPI